MDLQFEWRKCFIAERTVLYSVVPVIGFDVYCQVLPERSGRCKWQVYPQIPLRHETLSLTRLRWSDSTRSDAAGAIAAVEQYLRVQATEAFAGRESIFHAWSRGVRKELMGLGAREANHRSRIFDIPTTSNPLFVTRMGEQLHDLLEDLLG